MDQLGRRRANYEQFAFITLTNVFRYLPVRDLINCSRVCPTWKWIAASDILWSKFHVYVCQHHYQDVIECHGGNLKNLMLDIQSVNNFEQVCLSGVTKVEKIALTYCKYEFLTVLAKYNTQIKRMHVEFMDHFDEGPKLYTNFIHFKDLTHLEIVELSLTHRLNDAKFLDLLPQLEHLSMWTWSGEQVWYDVATQTRLKSLHVYAGDESCMEIMFQEKEIEKMTNLKRLRISNVVFEMYEQQNEISDHDRYTFKQFEYGPDYFAEENIAVIWTLLNMADQLEVVEWVIGESTFGVSVPYNDLEALMDHIIIVKPTLELESSWTTESDVRFIPYAEVENLLHLWMPKMKVSITHMETMVRNMKIPKCVVCDRQKIDQYAYFFNSFLESFAS